MDFQAHIAEFLVAQGLSGAAGVVAVSGGPDSVALAHGLLHVTRARLVLAHVNHQLRGGDSDADETFVVGLPVQWRPAAPPVCRVARFNTATDARGENLESTARDQRYAWLAQIAREEGAAWVATGHTADDQAETVLFRLLRGSGLDGLRGMAARRPLGGGIDLIRPLLTTRRADVHAYLEAQHLPCRQDRSNLDRRFTRNRIRHDLIPRLAGDYNPAVVEAVCRLAEQAREVQAEMHGLAEELLTRAELPRAGGTLVFHTDVLAAAPAHRLREMFRQVWQRERWPAGAMGFDEWQRLVGLVHGEPAAWDLPAGIRARWAGRVVHLSALPIG